MSLALAGEVNVMRACGAEWTLAALIVRSLAGRSSFEARQLALSWLLLIGSCWWHRQPYRDAGWTWIRFELLIALAAWHLYASANPGTKGAWWLPTATLATTCAAGIGIIPEAFMWSFALGFLLLTAETQRVLRWTTGPGSRSVVDLLVAVLFFVIVDSFGMMELSWLPENPSSVAVAVAMFALPVIAVLAALSKKETQV